MRNYLIADRYARSLGGAITDDSTLESMLHALQEINTLILGHQPLRNVLANPSIAVARQIAVLDAVLDRCEAPEVLKKLLAALALRRRVSLLPDVVTLFAKLIDSRLNRVTAHVTSAVALSEQQRHDIVASLEKYSGKHVHIEHAVDPEILGGISARIGGTIIDGSVRTRIERLKQSLLPEENLGG